MAGRAYENTIPLFTQEADDVFLPSELTAGPWTAEAQHGGPVSALAAGFAERVDADRQFSVVRISFEILRPLPLRPLRVTTEARNVGRSSDRVHCTVTDAQSEQVL